MSKNNTSMSQIQIDFLSQARFSLIRVLYSATTHVLLVKSNEDSKKCVLKIHSHPHEQHIHASLSHPNIIKYIHNHHLMPLPQNPHNNFLFMEYAPYGDFFDLILDYSINDEKLIRTYFHQIIKGLEYLHAQDIAHLDLKLENLLLGKNFILKIADFDLAQDLRTTKKLISCGGTANYRAPEVLFKSCEGLCAADVYSAGICLYVLMTGAFPFMEEIKREKVELFRYDTFLGDNQRFWEENQEIVGQKVHLSRSFSELINKMWAIDPRERATLQDVKMSRWYNEPTYTEEELRIEMRKLLRL